MALGDGLRQTDFDFFAGLVACSLGACAASSPEENEAHVLLEVEAGVRACAGEAGYVDRFLLGAFDALQLEVPPGFQSTLVVLSQEQLDAEGVCPAGAVGCAFGGQAWSAESFADLHEVVHTISFQVAPGGVAALSEGLADTLADQSGRIDGFTPLPLASYLQSSSVDLTTEERFSAGLHVEFLLREHGPGPFDAAYRDLPTGSTEADFDEAFSRHFGQTLAEADAEFVESQEPRCMVSLAQCGPLFGEPYRPPFTLEGTLDCDDPQTLGYESEHDDGRRPYRRFHVEIPVDGEYEVDIVGASFFFERCGSCDERGVSFSLAGSAQGSYPVPLEAGLYTVVVDDYREGFSAFSLSLDPL